MDEHAKFSIQTSLFRQQTNLFEKQFRRIIQ